MLPLSTVTGVSETMNAEVLPDPPPEVLPESGLSVDSSEDSVTSLARFAASSDAPPTAALTNDLLDPANRPRGKNLSRPKCLLPESSRKGDGAGPIVALDEYCSKLLVVTLGITDIVERAGLTVSVWGSEEQTDWGSKPLVTFRQRQYCGVYSVLLNMAMHTDIRYLRVQWNMKGWGKGDRPLLFGFEVFLEESGARVSSSAVA
jgi:hypothetical protein